jgi:hypothetical protein
MSRNRYGTDDQAAVTTITFEPVHDMPYADNAFQSSSVLQPGRYANECGYGRVFVPHSADIAPS